MALGRSIRIYLDGGEVSGVRHAELVNWTGQAVLCPRNRMKDLLRFDSAVRRPGVYFLIGADQPSKREVYIGESEVVCDRLQDHLDKDFWQEAILVTSKDEHLTKSHIKYLESMIVGHAVLAGRYTVVNVQHPPKSALPRADADAMEEYLSNIRLLLGALGHRVLDPILNSTARLAAASGDGALPPQDKMFSYSVREAIARGVSTEDGFVVLRGSLALTEVYPSMAGYKALRDELVAEGKLIAKGERLLEFVEDILFLSPTAAAVAISGAGVNGRAAWKLADGRTLKEVETTEAQQLV